MKCPNCKSTKIEWHPTAVSLIAFRQRNARTGDFYLQITMDEIHHAEGRALFSCVDCTLEFEG